jgi:hypothetical protein
MGGDGIMETICPVGASRNEGHAFVCDYSRHASLLGHDSEPAKRKAGLHEEEGTTGVKDTEYGG